MKVTSGFAVLAVAAAGLVGVYAPPATVAVEGVKQFFNISKGVNAQLAGDAPAALPAAKPLPAKAVKLEEYKR